MKPLRGKPSPLWRVPTHEADFAESELNSGTTTKTLAKTQIQPALSAYGGTYAFEQALLTAGCGENLLSLLACYVQFNSVFGSGVANLAGEIGARQDLFRDPTDAVKMLADRSAEVAAKIFCAAIDEFGDESSVRRCTHRSMAQATLRGAAEFFDCPLELLDRVARPHLGTVDAVRKVCRGYGLNRALSDREIFQGIGFHLASETLADQEFCVLDRVLRSVYPKLVAHLEDDRRRVDGSACGGYLWIRLHTVVEAEHSDAALAGANLAILYYAGTESRACVRGWILEGAEGFAATQSQFMGSLRFNSADECQELGENHYAPHNYK